MNKIKNIINNVKHELGTFPQSTSDSESLTLYLRYYGLDIPGVKHEVGLFYSAGYNLFLHVLHPPISKGTVICIHGYLSHSGSLKNGVYALLEKKLTVFLFDLPGHGLSSGKRASIDDFFEYRQTLSDLVDEKCNNLPRPFSVLGHSTGGGIVLDTLFSVQKLFFDKAILIAPLVRSNYWRLTNFNGMLINTNISKLPRRFSKNSSDTEFLRFQRYQDPLQAQKVQVKWIDAMIKWSKGISERKAQQRPLKIIQGTADQTVDWRYNIDFIQKKCKDVSIVSIHNGGHELLNESELIQSKVVTEIKHFFSD